MSSSSRQALEGWLRMIDVPAVSVLDIGGSQNPVKGRTKSWEAREYRIVDLPKPHIDSPMPDIALDINKPWTNDDYWEIRSDIVFCLEVFDYVWNPAVAFENIEKVMSMSAKAYVSFQSQYPLHNPVEDDALRLMPSGIGKLAQHAGLVVADMIPRRFHWPDSWYSFVGFEGMRPAKGEDHNFSGWLVELRK